jgi:hypothetical protein
MMKELFDLISQEGKTIEINQFVELLVLIFLVTREDQKSQKWSDEFELFLVKLDLSGGWEEMEQKENFI